MLFVKRHGGGSIWRQETVTRRVDIHAIEAPGLARNCAIEMNKLIHAMIGKSIDMKVIANIQNSRRRPSTVDTLTPNSD